MRTLSLLGLLGLTSLLALTVSACSSDGGSTTITTGCTGLAPATNTEFCEAQRATPDCSRVTGIYKAEVCGVPLRQPPGELARSANVEEYAGDGPPNLSCFDAATYPPKPGPSSPVKIKGIAKIFSNGCESRDVKIEVYTVKRTGGADDADLDQSVGTAFTTASDCMTAGVASDDPEGCGTRYECTYEIDDVPSETELVIRTSGSQWAPLYEYNIYIRNDEVEAGAWDHDVRALAQDDYTVIPQAALGSTITQGHGVIAGEVHDCDNVRLSNATVDVDQQKVITTYFTSNEEHPLPDLSAKATSVLGLYASMDIAPGPVTVAAAGIVGGELTTVGFFRARVFPDAVTSVTFRGLEPFQVP
jgi:hypothetical protein